MLWDLQLFHKVKTVSSMSNELILLRLSKSEEKGSKKSSI